MDIAKWGDIAAIAASPIGMLVMAFFLWKLNGEVRELKKGMNDNGFLKREDMEEAWKRADEIHKRYEEHLLSLDGAVARIFQDLYRR